MNLPRTPSFRLDGKRALVVGASSGIGRAAAVAFGDAGAEVTLAARRADVLTDLAKDMRAGGMQVEILPLDITDVPSTAETIASRAPYDILLNSAGLARHSLATDTVEGDYDVVTDLNVRAAYFLTRSVGGSLIKAGRPGSLINVSSQMAHVGGMERAVYCATKHAVEGFTKSMAIEWGKHGIRVNTICPTFILTDLGRMTLDQPDKRAWIEDKIKLPRVGEVEDVMGAAVFLASEAAAMITGTSLLVDGGWTAD